MKLQITFTHEKSKQVNSKDLLVETLAQEAKEIAEAQITKAEKRQKFVKTSPKVITKHSPVRTPVFTSGGKAATNRSVSKTRNQKVSTRGSEKGVINNKVSSDIHRKNVAVLSRKLRKQMQDELKNVERIGIWDLTGLIGLLPKLISKLNKVQKAFVFFEVEAPIPSDLVSRESKIKEWLSCKNLPVKTASKMKDNIIAEDFYSFSAGIREGLALHSIVGIVPSRITDIVDGAVWWNLFYSWNNNYVIVSTADLFKYAEEADKPTETAVMAMILAGLLQERIDKELVHSDTGCLFDLNEERWKLMEILSSIKIDDVCLFQLGKRYSEAAIAMLRVLNKEKRKSS